MESMFWSQRRLSSAILLLLAVLALPPATGATESLSDFQFRKVASVRIQADGPVDQPFLLDLIEITPGVDILTTSKLRRSIELLYATGNFTNILVDAQPDGDKVALTFQIKLVYRFQYVHLKGPLGISGSNIRKRLRLRKREPYTPEKILKGRDDILAVLRENGYYRARVTQDVLLHRSAKLAEVTYNISAGPPAYIESLAFAGTPFFPETELRNLIKASPGHRYREFDFQHDLDRIESLHDRNGFLEHNIRVTRKETNAQNRMELEITIDSGKQLLLTLKGYSLSPEILREQIPIWIDHSYNDDTLEEGKRNLVIYLQSHGYYDVSVEWAKVIEKEKILITYTIQPGTMYEISEIRVQGNAHFPTAELLKTMKSGTSGFLFKARLVSRTFDSDQERILSAYREKGYLFVHFVKSDVVKSPGGKLILDLEVAEEQQSIVSEIRMKGNEVISTDYFLQHFHQKIGEPISESKVKNDSNYIVALYSDRGYPKIRLTNKLLLSVDKTRAVIEYNVEEGEQVFVDRIVLNGNYRTKRDLITGSLFFAEDDPLSLRKVQESQSKLYALQIFDRVDFELPRPDSLHRYQEVVLKLTETKPYTIAYGIGFETYDKLRGVFTLTNRNWLGTARSLSLQLRGGFKEGRALGTFSDPHLFGQKVSSTWSIFAEKRSLRESFSYSSYGTNFRVEKKLSPEKAALEIGRTPPPQKSLFFGYRFENIDTFGTPTLSPLDRQFLAIHISSLSTSFARDARDNAIDPTTGTFLSSDLEWSTSILGSESDYLKLFSWGQYYRPFRRTVAAMSLRLGLADGFGKTISLPISQRFFAGGGRTIRGFGLDTAGPLDDLGQPLGGNMLFILNLENRFPIYHTLGGVIFFDWGNVFDLVHDFSFGDLRKTVGLGLRYKTAIGPIAFDYGYKLDRRFLPVRESPGEFFISIGQAF